MKRKRAVCVQILIRLLLSFIVIQRVIGALDDKMLH